MQIQQAIKELEQGNVVAIPTETVYGLAADATNEDAVQKIFSLKQRPSDNPLIVHVGNKSAIEKYAFIKNPIEQVLIEKLMPGPLTILLQKKSSIPDIVTAGSNLVAIRIPNHPITHKILEESGLALAAPSANISGRPSPTNAAMVENDFGNTVPVVDGGPCSVGIESTVVQVVDSTVLIHRPGFITIEDISSIIGSDVTVKYSHSTENISPGVKYKHYAPHAHIHLLKSGDILPKNSPKTGLIVTEERLTQHQCDIEQCNYRIYRRGSHADLAECTQKLYQIYNQADKDGISDLYIEELTETNGIAYAIMNRVKKSIT